MAGMHAKLLQATFLHMTIGFPKEKAKPCLLLLVILVIITLQLGGRRKGLGLGRSDAISCLLDHLDEEEQRKFERKINGVEKWGG